MSKPLPLLHANDNGGVMGSWSICIPCAFKSRDPRFQGGDGGMIPLRHGGFAWHCCFCGYPETTGSLGDQEGLYRYRSWAAHEECSRSWRLWNSFWFYFSASQLCLDIVVWVLSTNTKSDTSRISVVFYVRVFH